MIDSRTPKARDRGLVVQELPGEMLVYDTDSNKAHCLNESAAFVWKACDGATTADEIARRYSKFSNASVSEDLVWLAIDQLSKKGLLEAKMATPMRGTSRRDALKKIGLASMVAVPVIASLAAPRSALAATSCNCSSDSNCNLGAMCTTNMCDNRGTMATFTCIGT